METTIQDPEIREYVIGQRRSFHEFPEESMKERDTCAAIRKQLSALGIAFDAVGEYGTVARIDGIKAGKSLAFRADIDALPISEETGLEFASQNKGFMHACGHDGHIAMLLALGKALMENGRKFSGTIYLCFQQGEEIGVGQQPMIDYLKSVKNDLIAVLGVHLWGDIPVGKISVRAGAVMAGTAGFRIHIVGRGCHGSRPDQGTDVINAGVTLIGDAIRIKDREISPLDSNTLSFCFFQAGRATNVLPDKAELGGTMRFFSQDERSHLESVIDRACNAVSILTGCQITHEFEKGLPPVINHGECLSAVSQAAGAVFGEQNIILFPRIMGADNFGCYLQELCGMYVFVGAGNPSKGLCGIHHNAKFNIDEDALEPTVRFYLEFIKQNMEGEL